MSFFASLKDFFKARFPGVGEDRIVTKTQGCWSCTHWDSEKAIDKWWKEARANLLHRAVALSLDSPKGEEDPKVRNIRTQIPLLDVKFMAHEWGCCSVGKKADGTPVDDFVASTYACQVWTGKQGASVARAGAALDKLPEELMGRMEEKKVD